jgi:hypothetical protein
MSGKKLPTREMNITAGKYNPSDAIIPANVGS